MEVCVGKIVSDRLVHAVEAAKWSKQTRYGAAPKTLLHMVCSLISTVEIKKKLCIHNDLKQISSLASFFAVEDLGKVRRSKYTPKNLYPHKNT